MTTSSTSKTTATASWPRPRWAFIVDQVGAGGDASALGAKRDEYAQRQTSLLVDVAGSFLNPAQTATTWNGADDAMAADFFKHYGEALISIDPFTITDMSDDDAARLIASYVQADREQVFGASCPSRGPLLPPIRFAPGEADIHVDRQAEPSLAGMVGTQANVQRILNCNRPTSMPLVYASDEERRRIAKYEAAAELQESPPTSAIYKDCASNNGCRSRTAITVNGHSYYASYGRTQFVVETFLSTLRVNINNMSAQQRAQLRLDQPVRLPNGSMGTMFDMVRIANARATATANEFMRIRDPQKGFGHGRTAPQAEQAWRTAPEAERQRFRRETGLGEREFVDMLGFTPEGRARTEAEARNAFASEAVMQLLDGNGNASFEDWLMWLYSSMDEYNFVSKTFLQTNLSAVMRAPSLRGHFANGEVPGTQEHQKRQRQIEDDLAQRVAAMHNWGNLDRITTPRMRLLPSVRDYMHEFSQVTGRGDWRSLRCSDELKDLAGLQVQTFRLK